MTTTSTPFSPRNRTETGLGPLDITVEDARSLNRFDPNSLILACAEGKLKDLKPIERRPSDISGQPAVIVRTSELQMALTLDELERLTFRSLRPREFFALAQKYGIFFEIHDDYYDEDTGVAMQAHGPEAQSAEVRVSSSGDWVELVDESGTVVLQGHSVKPTDLETILSHFGVKVDLVTGYTFD